MSWNPKSPNDAASEDALDGMLREWRVPPASPWLASRVATRLIGSRIAPAFSLWLFPVKARVVALSLAVIIGWGTGMLMSAPEAAADGIEMADVLW